MNKRSIFTVIISIVLAFLCALLLLDNKQNQSKIETKNEVLNSNPTMNTYEDQKNIKEELQEEITNAIKEEKKSSINNESNDYIDLNITKQKQTQVTDEVVHEASIIEEVPDFGIMKDENGNIIITREFKGKTQAKYSFKDYGIIYNTSIK